MQEPLIIDVGANVGIFALWALHRWSNAKVICLEPLPPILEKLRENLGGLRERTMILPVAVGVKEELAQFFYFPATPGESTRNVTEALKV